MVFIRRVRTGSGATAVQIVSKDRGKRMILEHVGSAHTDVELAVLMQTARDRLEYGQPPLALGIDVPVPAVTLLPPASPSVLIQEAPASSSSGISG